MSTGNSASLPKTAGILILCWEKFLGFTVHTCARDSQAWALRFRPLLASS